MAVLPLTYYPAQVLKEPTQEIGEITADLRTLLDDMVDTMHAAHGIGLAGPQVGHNLRICVVDVGEPVPQSMDDDSTLGAERTSKLYQLINPRITASSGEITWQEGCLSLPDFLINVTRPSQVTVEALDPQGQTITIEASGLLAVAMQHEIDHLDGKLIIDDVSRLKKDMYLRKLKKILAADES